MNVLLMYIYTLDTSTCMSQALCLCNISAVQIMSTAVPVANAISQTTTEHGDSMQEEWSSDDD